MSVLGVGIDLCELDRIKSLMDRLGPRFLERGFTSLEIEYIGAGHQAAKRCAALFAAKEAVVKCLGTGFSCGIGWRQVEILHDSYWHVRFTGEAARRAADPPGSRFHLDISFTRTHAAAWALWSV
jgi:holo-[acyl-carrier protein] synthase